MVTATSALPVLPDQQCRFLYAKYPCTRTHAHASPSGLRVQLFCALFSPTFPYRLTKTEDHAEIKTILPRCNPYNVDIELTRLYDQFRFEVRCRATTPDPNTKQAAFTLGTGHIAPTWMFDPDELQDNIHHPCCHLTCTAQPNTDDVSTRCANVSRRANWRCRVGHVPPGPRPVWQRCWQSTPYCR